MDLRETLYTAQKKIAHLDASRCLLELGDIQQLHSCWAYFVCHLRLQLLQQIKIFREHAPVNSEQFKKRIIWVFGVGFAFKNKVLFKKSC